MIRCGQVHVLEECESTQSVARALVDEGAADGTCVVTKRQTAGRGRLGRSWIGPEVGLFLSMIVHARCPPTHAPRLTLGAAVGLLEALDSLGVHAQVKWPNDLVIPNDGEPGRIGPFRKVAGLLVEVASMRPLPVEQVDVVVLGIGVNVRGPAEGWPQELARTAGALADTGFTGDADDVLAAIRRCVPAALRRSLADFAPVLEVLRARSATLGRRVEIEQPPGSALVGEAIDLEADGALVVVDDAGARHVVRAGDVWIA